MTHRYLSTDYGVQCFACGVVLDYVSQDDAGSLVTDEATELEAMRFLAACPGPIHDRAHHYVFEGDRIACAYGDQTIGLDTAGDRDADGRLRRDDCIGDVPAHVVGSTHCYCGDITAHTPSITYPAP